MRQIARAIAALCLIAALSGCAERIAHQIQGAYSTKSPHH